MLNENNFSNALEVMNFTRRGNRYEKIFAEGVVMKADLAAKKLSYPAQIQNRERNNFFDAAHKENLVVFECVNRLLDKGYKPEDICLEKNWQLGHSQKSGRADICVSVNGRTLFIIECKTAGAEYKHELSNMLADGGQLFSYWQQEQSCQWIILYASDFDGDKITFSAASVPCAEKFYRDAHTVEECFKIWNERYEKKFLGDVIFHDETVAYKIGVKPLRKRDLKDFNENESVVNKFEEILRHNNVSDKENAFNRLTALFIAKLVDESHTPDDEEVSFQFKDGSDTHETFQDRLQKLYADGMKKFMGEDIFYLPEDYPDKVFKNFSDEENHDNQIKDLRENFRKLKFYTNNAFAFVEVQNDKLFYLNAKILREVTDMLRDYRIIGSEDLQTLGDLFEQLLDKGFKQDEGQFFTPTPIAQFIWDSLPLDKIISEEPPKIIDYACGAGHFLTEGFKAIKDFFAQKNLTLPVLWEHDKLFGVEKDYRLARVSKISLFMHGANEGKIKFGDGLENYPDENISPATFDILVANPPYSVKGFKLHLKLDNELEVFDKISNDGSEIETLFAERISQLVKPKGFAAVILPSSILSKESKSFIAARESLLKNFYIRAIVNLEGKTFGATSTNTIVLFLERFDEPPRFTADYEDVAQTILEGRPLGRKFSRDIFDGYLNKIGVRAENFKPVESDREKIIYFGLTYRQMTLIITAPKDNKDQEKFLGYGWSNAKGREGIVHKKRGGLLYDDKNRFAQNTLAAVIRAACRGEQIHIPALEKYYHYSTLADMIDFDAAKFTKKISLGNSAYAPVEYSGKFPIVKLGDLAPFVTERTTLDQIQITDFVTTDNMLKDKRGIKIYEGVPQISGVVKFSKGDVLISNIRPYLKKIWLADRAGGCSPDVLVFRSRDENILLAEYLFEVLREDEFFAFAMSTVTGIKMPRGDKDKIKSYNFPLPPLDVQKKIVEEFAALDAKILSAQEMITGLDADIKAKFNELFVNKNFPQKEWSEVLTIQNGRDYKAVQNPEGKYPVYGSGGIMDYANEYICPENSVVIGRKGTINKPLFVKEKFWNIDTAFGLIADEKILSATYLFYFCLAFDFEKLNKQLTLPSLTKKDLQKILMPLPPLELQKKFAAYVENCEALKSSARANREKLILEREELVTKYFR
ncbi:MAG: N-6 DNA methylase [Selenomonadaceae bacterium]|nr:N-6 DNA methylase [Selenomonadaceae bacterium]